MRIGLLLWIFAGLLLLGQPLRAQMLKGVEPGTAKAGDTLSASGTDLGKDNIDDLYLTDGSNDVKLEIVEQSDTAIKAKVPASVKPGRWALMFHTKKGQLVEQPVKVTIE